MQLSIVKSQLRHPQHTLRRRIGLLALAAGLLATPLACTNDDGDAVSAGASTDESTNTNSGTTADIPGVDMELLREIENRGKPEIEATGPVDELVVEDIIDGSGETVQAGDFLIVHYVGVAATSGDEFDSSWNRGQPASFGLNQVIAGWSQGLVGMQVGGRRTLTIPAELAYGDSGPAPGDSLIFTVDLVAIDLSQRIDMDILSEIEDRGEPLIEPAEQVDELVIKDDIEGSGQTVEPGDRVTVHYVGVGATEGEVFDSSWSRGQPISFGLNEVIQGWTEGMVGMKVGGRRTLVIPADMAYGNSGPAPGDTLIFTIDLIGIS